MMRRQHSLFGSSGAALMLSWSLLLVCLTILPTLVESNFLRDGFSSKIGNDAKSRMKLDDAGGAAVGMSREMFLMKDRQWELQPPQMVDFTAIKDMSLRKQCQRYLQQPVRIKLSQKRGKYGLRAVGELPSGQRLRGFWRPASGSGGGTTANNKGLDLLKIGYDEAIRQRLTTVEFELQLPSSSSSSRGRNKQNASQKKTSLPSVIYSITMEPGAMNKKAVVPRGGGSVRILPHGHGDGGESSTTIEVGKAYVTIPMRNGLVDPGWAKGRMAFRRGRSVGTI
ncbi:hypothetical protein IV203_027121 [Nitzschia inconspicua]|uniref:Uncharacterized protein n=1 Tax=Nitzschia inconspicua TaxID=303405 RepID=A0A9K3PY96_9STRA|nr:hypothetical protein IV203_027121 [Nitzschia inconspicua]